MSKSIKPFKKPIYITRPLLPDLQEFSDALKKVWESQWLTNMLGPYHNPFEKRLKKVLKVPYLSLFNNGTIALITACQSLKLSGEVITTPFTFPATPHALVWNGIRPVFCDIDPITLTINPENIEALITKKTTGILGVHVYGIPCDVENIQQLADRYHLKVIYDAAHAFGTEINGVGIGNFGDISMFSFHATKLFHTAEGGALTYRNKKLMKTLYYLKNFGIKNEEEVLMTGINGKMNEIQAALGSVVLKYVKRERKKRNILFKVYQRNLDDVDGISLIKNTPEVKSSYQFCVIRIDKKLFGRSRDYVHDKLRKYNIFARKYFFPLCSAYECYKHLPSSSPQHLPVATRVANEVLSLPFYGGLTKKEVEIICQIIRSSRRN